MTSGFLQLVGRIEQSLADLQMIVSRAGVLVDKYRLSLDDGYLGGVALNLQEGPKVACVSLQDDLQKFMDFVVHLSKVSQEDI